jgi:hypothetical protein
MTDSREDALSGIEKRELRAGEDCFALFSLTGNRENRRQE